MQDGFQSVRRNGEPEGEGGAGRDSGPTVGIEDRSDFEARFLGQRRDRCLGPPVQFPQALLHEVLALRHQLVANVADDVATLIVHEVADMPTPVIALDVLRSALRTTFPTASLEPHNEFYLDGLDRRLDLLVAASLRSP